MHISDLIFWEWLPVFWLLGGLLLGLHLRWTRFQVTAKTLLFGTGIVLAETALALPMGPAAGQSLFSMRMAQHILLLMLAPPFLVAGLPGEPVRKLFANPAVRKIGSGLMNPFIAWLLGIGIMWFWHAPAVFNYMGTYTGPGWLYFLLHVAEIVSLLGIGLLFCSPILFPLREFRLPPLQGIVYLFTACWGCSILGILITFAAPGLYHTVFSSGIESVWGLTEQIDQQLGGLLMWVPGCFIYVSGVITLLIRWFSDAEPAPDAAPKKTATV